MVVVLGTIARVTGFSILNLFAISGRITIVLGTSSSESALPRMLNKMENWGAVNRGGAGDPDAARST